MQFSPSVCSTTLSGLAARQAGLGKATACCDTNSLHGTRAGLNTAFVGNCSGFPSWCKWGMELLAAVCCRGSSVRRPP